MANLFQSALFNKPKYSKFDLSHDWKGSYEIGQLIPTYWRFVHPGERFIAKAEQLTRFAPMLAPVMHQFDVTIDWHFCPLRLLNVGSEDFFNMQKNSNYARSLPSVPLPYYLMTPIQIPVQGSLLDFLGYPTLDNFGSRDNFFVSYFKLDSDKFITTFELKGTNQTILTVRGFLSYLLINKVSSEYDVEDVVNMYSDKPESVMSDEDYYNALKSLGIDESSLFKQYLSAYRYIFYNHLGLIDETLQEINNSESPSVSLLPLYAYWRIVSDWYVNPNYVDNDIFFKQKWNSLQNYELNVSNPVGDGSTIDFSTCKPYLRNYASDYFTTSFLSTQVGNAVSIPTNGTIIDLRQANSIQKLRERALYAGKRYIDNVLAFFGVKSSDVRLDRTEVLARDTFKVNISAVTQTNQSDIDKMLDTPLGTYVGEGFSAGGRGKFDYTAEEHGIIMCMVSVRPKASYMQGINPLLTKSKVTDFIIPDLAQIGEQSIPNCHLFCDYSESPRPTVYYSGTFGYTRRYAEFMFAQNETHGDFRTNMNYWHATRMFDSPPSAGAQFNEISVDRDNLNRIFSVVDDVNHIYQYLYFDIDCISPLPRYVHYDL